MNAPRHGGKRGLIRLAAGALGLLMPLLSISGAKGATISNTGSATFVAGGGPRQIDSNTVTVETAPPPTPLPADGGQCQRAGSGFTAMPGVTTFRGEAIDTANPPVLETRVFHGGEPIFLTLSDPNRNQDAGAREIIELRLRTTSGDRE